MVDNAPQHEFESELRWFLLQNRVMEDRIKRAFLLFRENGIEPILIKGWAAGRNYPETDPRAYSDIDLAVPESDYIKAARLSGTGDALKLFIDLHRGVRHYDSLSWDDLFENSRLIAIDDVNVRVLRPEDHLRVLCVHWLNDGGSNKERLKDIYYAIANRLDDFDWHRCLDVVPEHRRKWILTTIAITRDYLDLDVKDLPFASELGEVPNWIKRCIEREWASDVHLEPVITHIRRPASLLKQIKKRIPPNPLRAIIETNGRIDARIRIFYQIGCLALMLRHPRGPKPAWQAIGQKPDR